MALKFEVETLEGVDEGVRGLYAKGDDGKFRLAVDGLPQPEDTSGLKKALQTERERAKAADRWARLGKTPEEVEELLAVQAKAEEERAKKAGDFDAIRQQDAAKFQKQIEALQAERDAAFQTERKAIIENRLISSLAKAGVTEEGLALLPHILAARVKIETVDGARVTRIMQEDGVTPLSGSGKDGFATFEDLAKEVTVKFPSLVASNRPGGGGKSPDGGAGGGSGKQMLLKDFEALSPADKVQVMKAGTKLVD